MKKDRPDRPPPDRPAAAGPANVTLVRNRVSEAARAARNGHLGGVMWFTGLPGAGKSTLAVELEQRLFAAGYNVYVLDGDNLRHRLNRNLGFSPDDRAENIRRAGEVAALFAGAGFLVITALISPYQADRDRARETVAPGAFHEVYINASLAACEARDPKGLYRRARAGEIADFTGISAPYEVPQCYELMVPTDRLDIAQCVDRLVVYVARNVPLNYPAVPTRSETG